MLWRHRSFPLFVIFIFFFWGCHSKKKEASDWEKFRLAGQVKSFTEKSYVAALQAGHLEKGKRERAPSDFDQDKTVNFNLKGMLTKERTFLSDNSLLFDIAYHYDGAGRLMEINRTSPQKELDARNVFEYDKNGNRIKQTSYNGDGTVSYYLQYFFDPHGNNIKKEWFQGGKIPDFVWTYRYDKNNNMIEMNWVEPDGRLKRQQKFSYDRKNRLIFQTAQMTGQTNIFKRKYVYDKKGRLAEELWNDGGDEYPNSYRYAYDAIGSQIRRTEYTNNQPTYIVERELEYFK